MNLEYADFAFSIAPGTPVVMKETDPPDDATPHGNEIPCETTCQPDAAGFACQSTMPR